MPRGASRIFREKVRSAANALGVDGTDFRNAGRGFTERARDAYADLGFSVGAAGRSSQAFRRELELANAELGISPGPPFVGQEFSIDFDGASELMQSAVQSGGVIGVGGTFSLACWFKANTEPLNTSHIVCDIGPDAGQTNEIIIALRQTGAGTNSVQFLLGDNGNNFIQSVGWSGLFTSAGTWRHVAVTWGGTVAGRTFYFDGVALGAPDFTGFDLDGTLDDTNSRRMRVGATRFGVQGIDGRVASVAWWNGVQLPALEVAAIFNGRNINFDLNANSGNYASAASLAHWHEVGKAVSPNLGADTAALAGTAIDIEAAAVGITDADRVFDVP